MADKMIEVDRTDHPQETDNGLREKRVNPDVLDSARELQWQLKMRKDILLTILPQTGIQRIQQKIHLTKKNHVRQLHKKCVLWF